MISQAWSGRQRQHFSYNRNFIEGCDPHRKTGSLFPEEEEQILSQRVRVPGGVQMCAPGPLSEQSLESGLASDHLISQSLNTWNSSLLDLEMLSLQSRAARLLKHRCFPCPHHPLHSFNSRPHPLPLRPLLPHFCILPTARPPSPPPAAPAIPAILYSLSALMVFLLPLWPSPLTPARALTPRHMVSSGEQGLRAASVSPTNATNQLCDLGPLCAFLVSSTLKRG